MLIKRLGGDFFQIKTLKIAKALLGKYLVVLRGRKLLVGKIVETEAYCGVKDKACHASFRRRETCAALWGEAGHAYVYLTYGLHWLLNVVTEKESYPAAVLVRALEPIEGIHLMVRNRELTKKATGHSLIHNSKFLIQLCSGPAKLTQALGLDGSFNGEDLTISPRVWIEDRGGKISKHEIQISKRVGVDYAQEYKDKPWRFCLKRSPFVSKG